LFWACLDAATWQVCDSTGYSGGEEMSKRQEWELKDLILEALEKHPDNTSQLKKRLGTNRDTVERHLKELRDYGEIRESTEWVNGNKKTIWRLNK
jgi:predicted ArsR family transcriptional regulator